MPDLGRLAGIGVLCPLNSQPYFYSSEMEDKGPSRSPSCCLDPTPQNTAVLVSETPRWLWVPLGEVDFSRSWGASAHRVSLYDWQAEMGRRAGTGP